MHRFFVSEENINGNIAHLDKREAHHIVKVLRLKTGDKVILFDGSGREYHAVLIGSIDNGLAAEITNILERKNSPEISLCLVQGIAKGDKMDNIIQKAAEIGVEQIYPLLSERTVVRLKGDSAVKKVNRWQLIAREASKQCRSNFVPEIKPVIEIADIYCQIRDNPAIMLYENEQENMMRSVLNDIKEQVFTCKKLFLMIGPEGGFADNEIIQACNKGVNTASLGPRILRTETAGIVASGIIMYEYGFLG